MPRPNSSSTILGWVAVWRASLTVWWAWVEGKTDIEFRDHLFKKVGWKNKEIGECIRWSQGLLFGLIGLIDFEFLYFIKKETELKAGRLKTGEKGPCDRCWRQCEAACSSVQRLQHSAMPGMWPNREERVPATEHSLASGSDSSKQQMQRPAGPLQTSEISALPHSQDLSICVEITCWILSPLPGSLKTRLYPLSSLHWKIQAQCPFNQMRECMNKWAKKGRYSL